MSAPRDRPVEAGGRRPLVLVTGLSGAGHSTALKVLEDRGYEAVDNLRLSLIPILVAQADGRGRPLAIGIDSRTRDFDADTLVARLEVFRHDRAYDTRLLFLDCNDEVLQRRFTETRRRHPLAVDQPVSTGIARERALLSQVRERADVIIDTSELSIHDLRRLLVGYFPLEAAPDLMVFVTSFSFKRGLPREADLVFDVRFLTNPHWDPALRPLDGRDDAVAARVESDRDFALFFERLTQLIGPLLPRYRQEGKSYLTIAVGCSGGRHRSVFVAERLAQWLRDQTVPVGLSHRELDTGGPHRAGRAPVADARG